MFTVDLQGSVADDTVYDDNTSERVETLLSKKGWTNGDDSRLKRLSDGARRVVGRLSAKSNQLVSNSLIFWPRYPTASQEILPAFGTLIVTLAVNGHRVCNIRGGYDFRASASMSRLSATIRKAFQTRLKGKFKDPRGKQPFQARFGDTVATITFEMAENSTSGAIVDIEFVAPVFKVVNALNKGVVSTLKDAGVGDYEPVPLVPNEASVKSPFRCDARSAESLMGLTMALETVLATNKDAAKDEHLQLVAGLVRKHTREVALPAERGAVLPLPGIEVNTAIRAAVDKLYEYNV